MYWLQNSLNCLFYYNCDLLFERVICLEGLHNRWVYIDFWGQVFLVACEMVWNVLAKFSKNLANALVEFDWVESKCVLCWNIQLVLRIDGAVILILAKIELDNVVNEVWIYLVG